MVRERIGAKGTGTVNTGGKGKTKPEKPSREGGTGGAPKKKIVPASARPPTLAQKINIGTHEEEEADEEPADNLQHRQRRHDTEEHGDGSDPEKDNTLTPRTKGQEARQETRHVRPVAVAPVIPEPVIELHISPSRQAHQEQELLLEPSVQQGLEARLEPTPRPELMRQQGTNNQWLCWIRE